MHQTVSHTIAIISVAYRNNLKSTRVPKSKLAQAIINVLYKSGLISSYTLDYSGRNFLIQLPLVTSLRNKYLQLKNVSTPGSRYYCSYKFLNDQYRGCPFMIVSNKGGFVGPELVFGERRFGGELIAVLGNKVNLRK